MRKLHVKQLRLISKTGGTKEAKGASSEIVQSIE